MPLVKRWRRQLSLLSFSELQQPERPPQDWDELCRLFWQQPISQKLLTNCQQIIHSVLFTLLTSSWTSFTLLIQVVLPSFSTVKQSPVLSTPHHSTTPRVQVCDGSWHHYAVSVSAQGVQLTLDGELWQVTSPAPPQHLPPPQSEKENPEVIDDWPLHPAADLRTTLTVGACWHGEPLPADLRTLQ